MPGGGPRSLPSLMPLTNLETGGIARCLAQIAERPQDHVDAFFEVEAQYRLSGSPGQLSIESRLERGLAVRLLRERHSWLASSDEISPDLFAQAVARVARARPSAVAPPPRTLAAGEVTPGDHDRLRWFVNAVESSIQRRHAAFPIDWDLCSHERWSRVIGAMLSPAQQEESFFSLAVRTPWARWGTLLLDLDAASVEAVAASLTSLFRAQRAPASPSGRARLVLGPGAAAVLLHEAVAHALETDTLALTGDPAAAIGVELGAEVLSVVDNPAGAVERVSRTVDDEGMPVVRRWLLRAGVVEQPLADLFMGAASERLSPGAARRGNRHLAPVPRSTHLELLPGEVDREALLAECGDGLYVPELSCGSLDPLSGELRLDFPYARLVAGGRVGALSGPGRIQGPLLEMLGAVARVADDVAPAGAGWCAKGGHRLAVWASAPSLLLTNARVLA